MSKTIEAILYHYADNSYMIMTFNPSRKLMWKTYNNVTGSSIKRFNLLVESKTLKTTDSILTEFWVSVEYGVN